MAILQNFVQMIIRGTVNGQQWQVSPCWAAADVDGVANDENFIYTPTGVANWFDQVWNGGGSVGVAAGFADYFRQLMTPQATINEVRVLARSSEMLLPEQQIYSANITGERTTSAEGYANSFQAASCYAISDVYGKRGASMRLPAFSEIDYGGNYFTPTALNLYRNGILEAFDVNPSLAGMAVSTPIESLNVSVMKTVSVRRVFPTPTGDAPSGLPKLFPYESPYPIQATPCTVWQMHDWVSTQNSRKVGRGD